MPARSKKQSRLMHGVCAGTIKKKGLSRKTACEFVGRKVKKRKTRKRSR